MLDHKFNKKYHETLSRYGLISESNCRNRLVVKSKISETFRLLRNEDIKSDDYRGIEPSIDASSTSFMESDFIYAPFDRVETMMDAGQRIADRLTLLGYFKDKKGRVVRIRQDGAVEQLISEHASTIRGSLAYALMSKVIRFVVPNKPRQEWDKDGKDIVGVKEARRTDRTIGKRKDILYKDTQYWTYLNEANPNQDVVVNYIWEYVLESLPYVTKVFTAPRFINRGKTYSICLDRGLSLETSAFSAFDDTDMDCGLKKPCASDEEAQRLFTPIRKMVDTISFNENLGAGKAGYVAALFGAALQELHEKCWQPFYYFYSDVQGSGKSEAVKWLGAVADPSVGEARSLTIRKKVDLEKEVFSAFDTTHMNAKVIELANVKTDLDDVPAILANTLTGGSIVQKHTNDTAAKHVRNNTIFCATGAGTIPTDPDFIRRTCLFVLNKRDEALDYENTKKSNKEKTSADWLNLKLRLQRVAEYYLNKDSDTDVTPFFFWFDWSKTCLKLAKILGYDSDINKHGAVSSFSTMRTDGAMNSIKSFLEFNLIPNKKYTSTDLLNIIHNVDDENLQKAKCSLSPVPFGKFLYKNAGRLGLMVHKSTGTNPNMYSVQGDNVPPQGPTKPKEDTRNEASVKNNNIVRFHTPHNDFWGRLTSEYMGGVAAFKASVSITHMYEMLGGDIRSAKRSSGKDTLYTCLFHTPDKNPSMSINEENGVFHCFSCGEGGDVISMIKRATGKSTQEVINLPIENVKPKFIEKKSPPEKFDVLAYCKNVSSADPAKTAQKLADYKNAQLKTKKPLSLSQGSFGYNDSQNFLFGKVQKFNGERWEYTGVHRLFLDSGDKKCLGRVKGGGVLVSGNENATTYVLSEGIGTAMAAEAARNDERFDDLPIYGLKHYANFSCISAGGIASFKLPPHVTEVIIVVDNDDAGRAARDEFFLTYSHLNRVSCVDFEEEERKNGYDLRDFYLEKNR